MRFVKAKGQVVSRPITIVVLHPLTTKQCQVFLSTHPHYICKSILCRCILLVYLIWTRNRMSKFSRSSEEEKSKIMNPNFTISKFLCLFQDNHSGHHVKVWNSVLWTICLILCYRTITHMLKWLNKHKKSHFKSLL